MEWSKVDILYFIEQYKKKPLLWDPKDPQYYSKVKKQEAWRELAADLETTEEECKRKMTSLSASLRRERAKIAKCQRTLREKNRIIKGKRQGLFISNWFAFDALGFLMDRKAWRENLSAAKTEENPRNENTTEENVSDDLETIKIEIDEIDVAAQNVSPFNEDDANLESHKGIMLPACSIVNEPIQKPEATAGPTLDECQSFESTSSITFDECQSFGLFVSNKLKNYSKLTRSMVQHKISNLLFEADQGRFDIV